MDLAKVDPRAGSTPDPAFHRETTAPRVSTDRPSREVNTRIYRPDTSAADQLAHILGVAADVASSAFAQHQAHIDNRDAANAALDFSSGSKDDKKFAASRAYRDSYQLEGAKKLAIDIGDEATQAVNDRLNNSDHPATPADVDAAIESVFKSKVFGQDGKLLDFGTAAAKVTLANAMHEVRSQLLPQAMASIKRQTDERMLGTVLNNRIYEYYRGAPIGSPKPPVPLYDLAPLPAGQDATQAPSTVTPYYHSTGDSSVREPFSGFTRAKPSSVMGAAREAGSTHNGEDFPLATGTPLVAPMDGEVIASFSNARGGNQVRVKMADGAIIGYAHLSSREVKVGDKVIGGQQVGLSGATGHATGPHVHMTVEQGGRKISPRTYFAQAQVPSGLPNGPAAVTTSADPVLDAAVNPQAHAQLAPFDFEGAMKAIPTSIDRKTAKAYVLQALINTASEKGDVGLLGGVIESKRKDGTPSLNPEEIAKVLEAKEVVSNRADADTEKARKQLWDKNHDSVMLAFLSDKPPSIGWLRQAAHEGKVDPDFAFSMENHIVSEQHQAASEARSEQRLALAEANATFDADVSGRIALRQTGDLSDATAKGDLDLFNSGQLGTGKQAISRYRQLRASARAGEQENLRNPDVAKYAGYLKIRFGTKSTNILSQAMQGAGQVNFVGMVGYYRAKIGEGKPPAEAYNETLLKFAPNSPDVVAVRQREIERLRAKRLGGGI